MAILLVAAGLRFTNVGLIPRFTDETDIIVRSLDIVRSGTRPLTDTEAYIGSGFNYILAATFATVGVGPVVPRYLVAVIGILTVVATFWLAGELSSLIRQPHGPRTSDSINRTWDSTDIVVGLLAAALLAVSPVHILVNSRLGWAHSTTPLFTTLALAILVRAVRRQQPSLLPAAGFVTGFALQTHPSVVALLPGMLVWLAWRGRPMLAHRRWLLLGILLGGLGCANLLVYNLTTGFDSVRAALDKSDAYDSQRGGDSGYLNALSLEGLGLARVLAGTIGTERGDEPPVSPDIVLWAAATVVVIAYVARRGGAVVPLVVVPFLLILPLLNAKFEPLHNGRYLMPIVPLVAAAWALAMRAGYWRLQQLRRPAGLITVGAVVVTLALPVWHFVTFERVALATSSNQVYVNLVERIREELGEGETVLLDTAFGGERMASGRRGVGIIEYYLLLTPHPPNVLVGDPDALAEHLETHHDTSLLVLLPRARRTLGTQFDIETIGEGPRRQSQTIENAGLYRATLRDE